MNEQDLIKQLKRADQAAGVPSLTPIEIDLLCRRARRSQRMRRTLSVAAGLIVVVGWWGLQSPSHEPVGISPALPIQATADQWAALEAGTQQLGRFLDFVEQERDLRQKERQVDAQVAEITAPLREALAQADLVAADMVADAQRLMRQRRRREAIKRYQRVIELFPQSPWARVADQQLNDIQPRKQSTQRKGKILCQSTNVLS